MMLTADELDEKFALLDAALEVGINTFDSAHNYCGGNSERVLGQWMEARGNRDEVVILTKGAHHTADRKRVTTFDITGDLYDSLARLKTDYVDLYVLHRDDPDVPVGPIVEVLNEHHEAGRIGAFGGSNWTVERIVKANEYAEAHGLKSFGLSSPNYSLADQIEPPWADCVSISGKQGNDARAWYIDRQMPVFTWSSLAQGFFSGRFNRATFRDYEEELPGSCVSAYCYDENFERLERAFTLAEERELTVPQIALAYILSQPLNLFALVAAWTGEEARSNIAALELNLTSDEAEWLDLRKESR
jgi:aryl-alcohol dehydrogenase-like predicted oxidoreductase